ncbi:hypothetical protein [Mariniphaga sp.]|uniref:hypothetical protein n=1 Tax=Mariniphaga sp. TaxID=1954475 RepID=UPI0035686281
MKKILFWTLAVLITFSAIIYQRKTGPTYDKKVDINIEGTEYKFKLVRSHGGESDCQVVINIPDKTVTGELMYRVFPTKNEWAVVKMKRLDDVLSASLPNLPPAGKYEYKIDLEKDGKTYSLNNGYPVIIRFKGDVPTSVLIPHVILMFIAMFLGNLAGIMALFKEPNFKLYTKLTFWTLLVGGLIFGPWVQWHAFGEAWAGVPFAWDLTDNKTLVAFIFWLLALLMNRKKERPAYTVVAAIIMLIIYSIPHSMYGSQLDPETGEIIQGWIRIFW